MAVSHISIRDFRNLARVDMNVPEPGFVLVGENGHGKTNLLEAIYYLQILRSIRGAKDKELTRFGEQGFHIAVTTETHRISVGFGKTGRQKKVTLDGVDTRKLSDAIGALPSVIFSPRDMEMISGAPSERRKFMDVMLAITSRRYLTALQSYRFALASRNSALRNANKSGFTQDSIVVWEPALIENGKILLEERKQWVSKFASELSSLCDRIGERGTVTMTYSTSHNDLAESLASKRQLDIKRGLTHSGPHRDDLGILLDGREIRLYGSAGQQRTAAIALRILEAATIRDSTGHEPVLLLDDPFAELDVRRSHRILELLGAGSAQTILAVPRPADIPEELSALPRFQIEDGVIASL